MEYLLTILIPIAAIAIIVICAKRIAFHAFQCKHCAKVFHIPWQTVVIAKHIGNEYMLVCPDCKTKDWCTEQQEK